MAEPTSDGPSRARLPIGDYDGSWYDDEPITEQQLIALRNSVEDGELPSYSRFVVRKVLAEVEQLRAQLAEVGETKLREDIATALDKISDECGRRALEYADERSPVLEAEEGAYWNAARLIREGKEQEGIDA